MSRGTATWLSCTTAVLLLGSLDLDTQHAKQLVLVVAISVFNPKENNLIYSLIDWLYRCLQYWWIALGIYCAFCALLAARRLWSPSTDTSGWTGPGRVLFYPCKTTHSRLFPKRHSFVYSYLVIGIPVGWEGACGGMISSFPTEHSKSQSWFSTSREKGWYHVDPEDYLERGGGHLGLRGKLDAYLKSQVCPAIPG